MEFNKNRVLATKILFFISVFSILCGLITDIIDRIYDNDVLNYISLFLLILATVSVLIATIIKSIVDLNKEKNTIEVSKCYKDIFSPVDLKTIAETITKTIKDKVLKYKARKKLQDSSYDNNRLLIINSGFSSKNELNNLKMKLYTELSNIKENYKEVKKYYFDVLVDEKIDLMSFNKTIFEYSSKYKKHFKIIICDSESSNLFLLENIQETLESKNSSNKYEDAIQRIIFIYIDNSFSTIKKGTSDNGDGKHFALSIQDKDINNIISSTLKIKYDTLCEDKLYLKHLNKCNNVLALSNIIKSYPDEALLDKMLIVIRYLLHVGDYESALKILKERVLDKHFNFIDNNHRFYYSYLYADALHLLCNYEGALGLLNAMLCDKRNIKYENRCNELKGHVLKHMGNFDCAEKLNSGTKRLLSIQYLNYLKMLLENRLGDAKIQYDKVISTWNLIDQLEPKNLIYKAALIANTESNKALLIINKCIEYFENINDHYIYNAYYIKAEIYRLMCLYSEAKKYYLLASGIYNNHHDNNLVDQVLFSLKYLKCNGLCDELTISKLKLYKNKILEEKNRYIQDLYKNDINKIDAYSEKEKPLFNLLLDTTIKSYENNTIKKKDFDEIMQLNAFIIL